jgi:hypothetical protein
MNITIIEIKMEAILLDFFPRDIAKLICCYFYVNCHSVALIETGRIFPRNVETKIHKWKHQTDYGILDNSGDLIIPKSGHYSLNVVFRYRCIQPNSKCRVFTWFQSGDRQFGSYQSIGDNCTFKERFMVSFQDRDVYPGGPTLSFHIFSSADIIVDILKVWIHFLYHM